MTASVQAPKHRAQRFRLQFPVRYRMMGMSDWKSGTTINISRTGILFKADERIPEESVLDIRICMPLKATLACQASIVRAEDPLFAVHIDHIRLSHG
jgi:hypothetical protein